MAVVSFLHRLRLTIRVTVVGVFLLITSLSVIAAISLQYYFSRDLASDAELAIYQQTANVTKDYLAAADSKATNAAEVLGQYPDLIDGSWIRPAARQVFAELMQETPLFYAIYIGFADGSFYELINLETHPIVRRQLQAAPQDRWVVLTVTGEANQKQRRFDYFDADFNLRVSRSEKTDYDPRQRPWFTNAGSDKVSKTDPYLFQHLQAPGQTYSTQLAGQQAVLAVDITLSALSDFLLTQPVAKGSEIYLFQQDGSLIASNQGADNSGELPPVMPLTLSDSALEVVQQSPTLLVSNELDWPPIDFAVSGQPYGYAIDLLRLLSQMIGVELQFVNGLSWADLVNQFKAGQLDVLQPLSDSEENSRLGALSQEFLDLPYGVLTLPEKKPVRRISELFGKTVAIPRGWSIINTLKAQFPAINVLEVNDVAAMFAAVKNRQADAGLDNTAVLQYTQRQYFIDGVSIHSPLNFEETQLPTGLHFLFNDDLAELRDLFDLALQALPDTHYQALAEKWLGEVNERVTQLGTVPYQSLLRQIEHADANALSELDINGEAHFVYLQNILPQSTRGEYFAVLTPVSVVLAPAIAKVQQSILLSSLILLLMLPLAWWYASFIVRPIKQMTAQNRLIEARQYDELQPITTHIREIERLAEAISGMAMALQQHELAQKQLLEAFIQLIAEAIDDKSPYTAAHCERVPELAFMLTDAAEATDEAPFADFCFANDEQRREFRLAAWLHDCGKVTTPEHIVDKGTKLETIYNRIHEIRMRFEVLWRDTEIDYWQQRLTAPENEAAYRAECTARQQKLQAEFALVAHCNVGSEFLDSADAAELKHIGQYRWQRHFDNRLGLSELERSRYPDTADTLPVSETLLADKPEHIERREQPLKFDPRLGINMQVPEYLYNRGELHNLLVCRGTLTAEDRFKINEHIISTIKILDKLPLPPELANVPRYASTHHERLDGKGYPRGLTADDLSIPERIMVLADIFEALTASDRPYKKAKPVSVAVDILHKMVKEQHVDTDVFELFLRSGVYLDYARRFLPPEQIDSVEISDYLR